MANKKTRSKAHRRDRRKAKESGWKRGTKQKMNGTVVHGPTGSNFTQTNGTATAKSHGAIKKKKKAVGSSPLKKNIWEGQDALAKIQEDLQLRDTKNFQTGFEKGVDNYWNEIPFENNPFVQTGSSDAFFRGWNRGWQLANQEVMNRV